MLFSDDELGCEEFGFIPRNPGRAGEDAEDACEKEDVRYERYLHGKGITARVHNGYIYFNVSWTLDPPSLARTRSRNVPQGTLRVKGAVTTEDIAANENRRIQHLEKTIKELEVRLNTQSATIARVLDVLISAGLMEEFRP